MSSALKRRIERAADLTEVVKCQWWAQRLTTLDGDNLALGVLEAMCGSPDFDLYRKGFPETANHTDEEITQYLLSVAPEMIRFLRGVSVDVIKHHRLTGRLPACG